jgi:hypothetical protein
MYTTGHAQDTTALYNNNGGNAMNAENAMNSEQLVTAQELEARGVMRKGTAYRMAKAKKLIHYKVGNHGGGIRFRVDEVLAALRVPAAESLKP